MHSVRNIELVRALAEHRNFGRAAAALRVSQPALTRSLKHLEDRLGVTLFDRAGVKPTEFGEIVLRHGDLIVAGFVELKREIAMRKGLEVGELAVAMAFFPADVSGCEAGAALLRSIRELQIDLRMMEPSRARDAVLARTVDLGFADLREAENEREFVVERVRSGPIVAFCAADHPLARLERPTPADLMQYPWAGPTLSAPDSRAMPRDALPCGVIEPATGRFRPRMLVETFAHAKRIVLTGAAISGGLPFQIEAELAAGDLVLLTEVPIVSIDYGFIMKRGRTLPPAARTFMALVREVERRARAGSAKRPEPTHAKVRPMFS